MYHCLDNEDEETVFMDKRLCDDNTAPTAEMSEDSFIRIDEEDMKVNPSKIILPEKIKGMEKNHKKS